MRKPISLTAVVALSALVVGCGTVQPRVFAYPNEQAPVHQQMPQAPVYQPVPPPPPAQMSPASPYQPAQVFPYPMPQQQSQYPYTVRNQYQDDAECKQWAYSQVGTTPDDAMLSGGARGAIGGGALGAGLGAVFGAITKGGAGKGAAIGAIAGGALGGLGGASRAHTVTIQNLENAWGACMQARGYSVR